LNSANKKGEKVMKTIRMLVILFIAFTPFTLPEIAFSEEARGIEEIVVTSRRREESVQDVPLSVTAFGTEQIDRLKPTTLRDFEGMAPNLYMTKSAAGPSVAGIFIRGIGYGGIEKTNSPQVGMIVDGLQMGSSTGALIDAFDIESLEINRGPQGVLFGKNTLGGNIVVNRVKPQFNEFGVKLQANVGNYSSTGFKGRVNIPLVDNQFALKIGFVERERDGFYDNDFLGGTAANIDYSQQMLALRWAPSENVDVILTYDRIRDDSDTNAQDPRFDGDNPFQTLADKDQPTFYEVDQIGLRVDWDIGDRFTLNSITGFHDSRDKVNQDFDSGAIDGGASPFAQLHTQRDQDFEVFTQELRVSGDLTDSVSVMAGIYYYNSDHKHTQHTNNVIQVPFGLPPGVPCAAAIPILRDNPNPAIGNGLCQFPNSRSLQLAAEEVTSWSYFGSVTWRPTNELEFTLGARYIDEEKDDFNSYFDFGNAAFDDRTVAGYNEFDFSAFSMTPGVTYAINNSWDDVIITASASWAFTDHNRAYVNYSEGFRSGGFSIRSAREPSEAAYQPEDGWQVEAGLKNEFLGGALRANFAYFFLERNSAQFSNVISLPPGSIPGTTTIINNGATSETKGLEAEIQWLINEEFTLALNGGFIDVQNMPFTIACEVLDGCTAGGVIGADPLGTLRTVGGNDDAAAPDWTVNLVLAYDKQIGPGLFSANAGYRYNGEFVLVNTGGGQDQKLIEGSNKLIDARIAYEWQLNNGSSVTVSLYGKNLSDTTYRESALFLGGFLTGFQSWAAPRTYALELTYSR
jgi:iron complex outermembrane receptor protein